MKTDIATTAQLSEAAMRASLDMLRQRVSDLMDENDRLRALVKEIPSLILTARLDAKEGKETTLARKFYV